MQIEIINFEIAAHQNAFLGLLDAYMGDDMGLCQPLKHEHGQKVIKDLKAHGSYVGFLVEHEGAYIALANCFVNYSTFAGQRLLNIHDFVVHPLHRQEGAGFFLLKGIENYARRQGYCRINLEVRNDNAKAMALYRKFGFEECTPPMFFWEKKLG